MCNVSLKIRREQEKQKEERCNLKKSLEASKAGGEPPEKWKILCGTCKAYLTTGDRLRNYDQHTVVKDPEFVNNTRKDFVEKLKGNYWGDIDYVCKDLECSTKVAWGMVNDSRRYPTLSIRKILLLNDRGEYKVPGQRKNFPFKIKKNIGDDDDDVSACFEKTDKRGPAKEAKRPTDDTCIEMIDMWNDDDDE